MLKSRQSKQFWYTTEDTKKLNKEKAKLLERTKQSVVLAFLDLCGLLLPFFSVEYISESFSSFAKGKNDVVLSVLQLINTN